MVAVVAVVLGARRRHGPERHPPPLLLLPLEVAVVELEVVVLDGLGEGELLRVPDFCEEKKRSSLSVTLSLDSGVQQE